MIPTCKYPGCTRRHWARNLCSTHYSRWHWYHIQGKPEMCDPILNELAKLKYVRPYVEGSWCKCPEPDLQPVVLFGWLRCLDVLECRLCGCAPAPVMQSVSNG